ncbi:Fur family transcriptional regulator [Porticoccus sp. W117]|uniref:Fur family transcriptional regulator n=1 Tax=Porticoccus sp. W117 TaxID=3054777 RepID=UPI002595E333|nr:Fur family transcriptional regulator [Porticoccus sp. W117]MDM3870005.1 Fur family transcriptional regulator [Porticoccus sp. W117]
MNTVQEIIDHAENSCKTRGSKLTSKRKCVLSALLQSNKAMSAYELVDYCKQVYDKTLPPMSVYRILDFLQEEHLAHKLNMANKYIACSHITCSHGHGVPQFLICNNCQQVKEISVNESTIDTLKHDIEQAGFQMASPRLEINCLCGPCSDKAS